MKATRYMFALAAALAAAPMIAAAQYDIRQVQAIKAAQDAVDQDIKILAIDQEAAQAACQNPGAECDAARTRVNTDRNQLQIDKDALQKAKLPYTGNDRN